MSDKSFIIMVLFVSGILAAFLLAKIWAKDTLCTTYYPEMNQLACFLSDSTLPQRNNR